MLAKRHALNRIALATALTVCSFGGSAYQAYAQEAKPKYLTITPNEKYKTVKAQKELEEAKRAAFRGSFDLAAITNSYKYNLLPLLTSLGEPQDTNTAVGLIRADRNEIEKLDAANMAAVNKELFNYYKAIALGNYTPAASINAMLLLGEMSDERGGGNLDSRKPHGGPAALGLLLNAATKGSNDGVRAAAFVGLERHVRYLSASWNDNNRNTMATRLLAIAKEPRPPQQSEEAHAYLSSRALKILRTFKHDKGAEAVAYATDVLANEFTHPLLREEALAIVGKYDIPDDQQAKLVAAGRYSMRYMKNRMEHWTELYGSSISTSGGGGGGGGGMMAGAAPDAGYSGGIEGSGAQGAPGAMFGSAPKKEKEKSASEKQNQETRMLRRFMHEIVQSMRYGMSGANVGEVPEEFKNGLLSKMPEGEERAMLVHAVGLMDELQKALNDDTIEAKADFPKKDITKKIENLIAIAEEYPGAVDQENEAIVVEDPAATETADASETPDPAVGITPEAPAGGDQDRQ